MTDQQPTVASLAAEVADLRGILRGILAGSGGSGREPPQAPPGQGGAGDYSLYDRRDLAAFLLARARNWRRKLDVWGHRRARQDARLLARVVGDLAESVAAGGPDGFTRREVAALLYGAAAPWREEAARAHRGRARYDARIVAEELEGRARYDARIVAEELEGLARAVLERRDVEVDG